MFGIVLKTNQFPDQWVVDPVAAIIVRDTRADWLTYSLKVKVTNEVRICSAGELILTEPLDVTALLGDEYGGWETHERYSV